MHPLGNKWRISTPLHCTCASSFHCSGTLFAPVHWDSSTLGWRCFAASKHTLAFNVFTTKEQRKQLSSELRMYCILRSSSTACSLLPSLIICQNREDFLKKRSVH